MDSFMATFANVTTETWLIVVGVLLLLWLVTWWLVHGAAAAGLKRQSGTHRIPKRSSSAPSAS